MPPNKEELENSHVVHDEQKVSAPKWTFDETKLLIACVKEQPELYDPSNSKYKLLSFTETLWANFDLLLKKPMGSCKERWGILRQTFRGEYRTNRDKSKWKLYKEMEFLSKFLYSRGPSLSECIESALKGQVPTQKIKKEQDSNRMVSVISVIPDDCRNENDSQHVNITLQPPEQSISMELYCEEEPQTSNQDYTFAIPKLEPVSIKNQLPHMSTPIVPRIVKRSIPDAEPQYRAIKVRKSSPEVMNLNKVKLQKLSTTPGKSERYTLMQDSYQQQIKVSASQTSGTQIERISTPCCAESSLNRTVKPHEYPACSCTADGDMMFMQSLLPDLKKLNSKQRLEFKVQTYQLLQGLLYKN
ncbi:uncharacterized protein LOC134831739 [Culicoides brevitarsis]|uniref:uncharacterized protein LOC134831739 n=1 Tax=Culicoides brevitarsis TaxID=469753 RepID=UPI00307BCA66